MKRNKRRVLVILCLLLGLLLTGCTETEPSEVGSVLSGQSDMEYVLDKGTLVIGVTEYAPIGYCENGGWTGFDVELAEAYAKQLGVTAQFVEIDWNDKVTLLNNGSIDCIWNGMTLTEKLQESISCSVPYLSNAQVIVLPKDKLEQYHTPEECQHMLFAVEEGSAGAVLLENLKYRFVPVNGQKKALETVQKKESDAALVDIVMASFYTAQGREFDSLACGLRLNDEKIGVGLRKDSDLTESMNTFLKEVYEDGTILAIARKYGLENALLTGEETP